MQEENKLDVVNYLNIWKKHFKIITLFTCIGIIFDLFYLIYKYFYIILTNPFGEITNETFLYIVGSFVYVFIFVCIVYLLFFATLHKRYKAEEIKLNKMKM